MIKQIIKKLPAIILLFVIVFYWFDTGLYNPFAIFFLFLFSFLILFKNKFLRIFVTIFFNILSFYMILAVVSEFNNFKEVDKDAVIFLVSGVFIFSLSFISSAIIGVKESLKKN